MSNDIWKMFRFSRGELLAQFSEQIYQIIRVLFFNGENIFHHTAGSGIVVAEVIDHVAITVDRNAFSDQIFLDHVGQSVTFDIFSVTARQQTLRVQIRFPAELDDTVRNLISMTLFVVCMLQKLRGHALSVNSRSHKIVALVAQDANDLSG